MANKNKGNKVQGANVTTDNNNVVVTVENTNINDNYTNEAVQTLSSAEIDTLQDEHLLDNEFERQNSMHIENERTEFSEEFNEVDTLDQQADELLQQREMTQIENDRKRLEQLEADRKAQAEKMDKMDKMIEALVNENKDLKSRKRLTYTEMKQLDAKRQGIEFRLASFASTLDTVKQGKQIVGSSITAENDHDNQQFFALALSATNAKGENKQLFSLTNIFTISKVLNDTETAINTRIDQLKAEVVDIESMMI